MLWPACFFTLPIIFQKNVKNSLTRAEIFLCYLNISHSPSIRNGYVLLLCHTCCKYEKIYARMLKKTTVDSWGMPCTGYEKDSAGNVILLWCQTCREFYQGENMLKKNCKFAGGGRG